MTELPSPAEIKYFIEIAHSLNLSRAAERLGIRQPTLSVALARLEKNLDIRLFTRTKKGVTLTEAGESFLAKSQDLMQLWTDLRAQTQNQAREIRGHVRIGCHASVALYTVPLFLPDVLKEFPDLEVALEHDFSRKITESVISLKLDLGIVVNPVQHPDLVIKKVCDDEVCFWSSKNPDPSTSRILIADQQLHQTHALLKKIKKSKQSFDKFISTSSLEVARELAAAGGGVAILPTRVAASAPLKRWSHLPSFHDEVCVIYRVERKRSPTLQMLAERIKNTLSN